jgi:hypothetical protein
MVKYFDLLLRRGPILLIQAMIGAKAQVSHQNRNLSVLA